MQVLERVQQGDPALAVVFAVLVYGVGALQVMQTCVNRVVTLRHYRGDAVPTIVLMYAIGSLVLAAASGVMSGVMAATGAAPPWALGDTSAWMYTGGAFGAAFVYGCLVCAPRVGMARLYMCIVFGQLVSSLVYDHFALLGVTQHSASPMRIAGTWPLLCDGGVEWCVS